MQRIEQKTFIETSMLFRGLEAGETSAIVERLQMVSYTQGTHILERGTWHGKLYIIISGQVSVVLRESMEDKHRDDISARPIAQLGPGECFGEMSLITGEPPSATVRAEQDTVLWSLSQGDFMALMSICPTLLRNITAILAQRLVHMNHHIPAVHSAEKVWIALIEAPGHPLAHSLALHIADALAHCSRKRVLLIDMNEQGTTGISHFATYIGQLRPSLLECAHDYSMLQLSLTSDDAEHTTTFDRGYSNILLACRSFSIRRAGSRE